MQPSQPTQPPEKKSKVSPGLVVFLLFPLFGIITALALAVTNSQPAPADQPARAIIGQSAPKLLNWAAPDFELLTLTGETVRLADLKGRPVFLNFWATWCAPCVEELPAFQTFIEQQPDGGAVVLAVNSEEPPEQITAFFERLNIEAIPVLLDTDAAVRRAYGIVNLPTTYIIDPEGIVRFMRLGAMTVKDMNDYLVALEQS